MVRELFVMAREHAPTIIFMDEVLGREASNKKLVVLSDRLVASVCTKCCRYLRRKVFGKSHRFHDSMLF